ncbi:MAG: trypsin-like peptidase domain-containing protein [Acidobacteriota bacterium]
MIAARIAVTVALLAVARSVIPAENISCQAFTAFEINRAKRIWTEDQKRAATPVLMPPISLSERLGHDPNRFASGLPHAFSMTTLAGSTFPVQLSDKTTPPFESVGKLFFTDLSGARDWCTASFTEDPHVLMTAAHCVRSSRGFFIDLYFTRAYAFGGGENFSITRAATLDEWVTSAKPARYDVAFLMTKDPATVPQLTFASILVSQWTAVGYPYQVILNGYPTVYDGSTMIHADGNAAPANVTPKGMILMTKVPLGKGTSGGPFIPPAVAGGIGKSVLTVASNLGLSPNQLVGPVFGKRAKELFDHVKAGCPRN